MNKRKYYVYVFTDKQGCYRYVGKGTGKRYKYLNGRTRLVTEFLRSENFNESIIIHGNLTENEAIDIENGYLNQYLTNPNDQWKLLNHKSSSVVKPILYSEMVNLFKISEESASGIVRLNDFVLPNGGVKFRALSQVGYLSKSTGYYHTMIDGSSFLCHRIIWCLANKQDVPVDMVINHIDSNRSNNHMNNLEMVTIRDNNLKANRRLGSVRWREKANAYEVRWSSDSKQFGKYFNVNKHGSKEAAKLSAEYFLNYIKSVFYKLDSGGHPYDSFAKTNQT